MWDSGNRPHARRIRESFQREQLSMPRTSKSSDTSKRKTPTRKRATTKRKVVSKRKTTARKKTSSSKRWSQRVTENSDALDLADHVFARKDPRSIARSLKRSAEASHRRKSDPYRAAMSMLTFYVNRAGKTLPATQRRVLEKAKEELRELFGRK